MYDFKKTKTIGLKNNVGFDTIDKPNNTNNNNDDKLYLIYVHKIGENSNGNFEYDLLFSKRPNVAMGIGWESTSFIYQEPSDKKPENEYIDKTYKLISDIELMGIQEMDEFRMLDSVYGIVSLAWELIDDYALSETLPEDILTFKFGELKEDVDKKLYSRDLKLN
jgi:hypothetical protein